MLQLDWCRVTSAPAAAAAIAASPALRNLSLTWIADQQQHDLAVELQTLAQLTRFSFTSRTHIEQLAQLSAAVNLQHLKLHSPHSNVLAGGVLLQLTRLTSLHLMNLQQDTVNNQLQHVSCLTALRDVAVKCDASDEALDAGDIPGIQHLSQLTQLRLSGSGGMPDEQLTAFLPALVATGGAA